MDFLYQNITLGNLSAHCDIGHTTKPGKSQLQFFGYYVQRSTSLKHIHTRIVEYNVHRINEKYVNTIFGRVYADKLASKLIICLNKSSALL